MTSIHVPSSVEIAHRMTSIHGQLLQVSQSRCKQLNMSKVSKKSFCFCKVTVI